MPTGLLPPIGVERSRSDWRDIGEAVKPTHPGHGSSALAARDCPLVDLADLMGGVPGPLVGVSIGGMANQHVASRHPTRLRSMVPASTTVRSLVRPWSNVKAREPSGRGCSLVPVDEEA
ncbi:MAG TPA: alpha/beta hydrolase [Acidimicrobiales bacterium]|nr:alpha/beta hydrolase [Acidimicrobiales bacterium]